MFQDKRYWNDNKNNQLSYTSFNNWEIQSNNYSSVRLEYKIFDLQGYNNYITRSNMGKYYDEQQIIDLILALEDWSINCPYFNEGIKKYES